MVHEMFQDHLFDDDRQQHHDPDGQDNRHKPRQVPSEMVHLCAKNRVDQVGERYLPLLQPDKRQRGEQGHNPLGIVENSRRLKDQNKPQRHEGIENTGHQTVDHHLNCIKKLISHGLPPDRRRSRLGCCAPHRGCRRRFSCRNPSRPRGRTDPSPRPCRVRSGRSWCRIRRSHRG